MPNKQLVTITVLPKQGFWPNINWT